MAGRSGAIRASVARLALAQAPGLDRLAEQQAAPAHPGSDTVRAADYRRRAAAARPAAEHLLASANWLVLVQKPGKGRRLRSSPPTTPRGEDALNSLVA